MKTVMPTALALTALLWLASPASVPGGEKPPEKDRVAAVVDRMKTNLGLTDEQVPRVEAILRSAQAQAAKDRETAAGDQARLSELNQERNQRTTEQVSEVLTEAQRAKWEQIRAERRARREGARERPPEKAPAP